MDYFQRVGRSLDYIEENLEKDLDLADVAAKAYCSLFYFHRIFAAMLGDTIKEYIRKRRLTEAARRLVEGDGRILDIAMDLGYGSQEAFSRAFKSGYGVSPGEFRSNGLFYALRERKRVDQLPYDHLVRSGKMEVKIVQKDAFSVIGSQIITKNDGSNNKEIPLFWEKYMQEKRGEMVPNRKEPWAEYGICGDMDEKTGTFQYIIGEEVTDTSRVPEGMIARTIPAATYAVFTAKGPAPESIQKVWEYAYGTWLPGNEEWERADTEDFEVYDERCTREIPEFEICIPVRRKS